MEDKKTVVLERSNNPHTMKAVSVDVIETENDVMVLKVSGTGVVLHGEHGTIATESPDVVKAVQQEFNPVTKGMQKAFD